MSKPIALLAYQEADIEKQQIEADLKTTENRIKMNKRAKFIKQQQATLQKLTDDMEAFSASMFKMNTQYKAILDRLDLESSEFETLKGDEECTSEEMTEFRHDIEKLQREAGNLEKEIKQLFRSIDEAVTEYQKTRQQGIKAKKEYDQLKALCQKEKDDAAIDMLAADRKMAELEKRVNPTLMNRYKRVRQHHNIPLVEVRDGKCSGCNMSLPSLSIRRLITEDMILECDNCGRLLYADNE
jgi:predicted  nucleic acid-binding Zn-ribbon protein